MPCLAGCPGRLVPPGGGQEVVALAYRIGRAKRRLGPPIDLSQFGYDIHNLAFARDGKTVYAVCQTKPATVDHEHGLLPLIRASTPSRIRSSPNS